MKSFKVPNEVLFRLHEPTGPGAPVAVKGAHVSFNVWTYEDDGTFISAAQGTPESIAVGTQKGFPLEQVLNSVLAATLLDRDNAHAELEVKTTERDTAVQEAAAKAEEARVNAEAREKMRVVLGTNLADMQKALADEEAAEVVRVDVVDRGT